MEKWVNRLEKVLRQISTLCEIPLRSESPQGGQGGQKSKLQFSG